jgi:hypothetical protein
MKNIREKDENAKAWLDFVELVREFRERRDVRVVGQYIARTPPSEEKPWAIQAADELLALSPEEEEGLLAALASLLTGRGVAHEEVRERVLRHVRR